MQTCSHGQPSAPTPPILPNEKCNLPSWGRGGRVLGSFSCAYIGYLSNYYSAKPQFTTDFMSRLRLKMSDKQNVCGVCLCVLHMQKKKEKKGECRVWSFVFRPAVSSHCLLAASLDMKTLLCTGKSNWPVRLLRHAPLYEPIMVVICVPPPPSHTAPPDTSPWW